MNSNDHIEVEDLAMFALLLLDRNEAEAVREHLRECAGCREELLRVREDLATYALSVEPLELPGPSRDRFIASLPEETSSPNGVPARAADPLGTTQSRPEGISESRPAPHLQHTPQGRPALVPPMQNRELVAFSRFRPLLGWAGWAVAAAILLVALGLRQNRNALQSALAAQNSQIAQLQAEETKARQLISALTGPGAVRVNLSMPKAPALPSARAVYEPRSGTLLLTASHLAPLPAQKAYELWLIPADGGSPIPAGTFSPDSRGEATVLLPPLPGGKTAKAFGITMEPSSGSATPTLPILLAGAPA